jgi:hypothetical protein
VKTKLAIAALASAALLPACGHHRGYARDPASQERQYAADLALAECQLNIEVFLPGMRPTRPFRVIGPIEGNWGWTVESRFTRMKKKACELGASAIMDAEERYEAVGGSTTRVVQDVRFGRPIVVVEEPRQTVRRTSAFAIVNTDLVTTPPAPAAYPGGAYPGVVYSNAPSSL